MSPRSTAVLAMVALAFGAFIWLYEIEGEDDRREAEEAAQEIFAALDASAIEWIALETTDDFAARLERADGRWWLREPLDFPADAVAVDAMAGALADLAREQAIEAGQPLSVYGLDDGAQRVEFGTANGSYALRIGDKAPLGSNTYVARGADDAVFTVPTWRINALSEELLDLRDRRVLSFDQAAVRRIEARWPEGEVVIEKGEQGWQLVAPIRAPADEGRIDGLLADLSYLRSDGFVDDALGDAEAGLAPPDYEVILGLEGDDAVDAPMPVRFALGRTRSDGQRLARGAHATFHALGAERIDEFPRTVVEYRDRRLSAFVASEADRMELVFAVEPDEAGGEQGARRIRAVATRDDTSWSADPPWAEGMGSDLVTTLSSLEAVDVVAEEVGTDERAGLGLAPARALVRVLGRPSGDDGKRPLLAEVHFGSRSGGDGLLAMRSDRPQVYRLAPTTADRLPVDHAAFESRFLAPEPAPGSAHGSEAEAPSESEADAPAGLD